MTTNASVTDTSQSMQVSQRFNDHNANIMPEVLPPNRRQSRLSRHLARVNEENNDNHIFETSNPEIAIQQ